MTERILITGGAGQMAALLRPRLRKPGRILRLLDLKQASDLQDGEESLIGNIIDAEVLSRACHEVDAVVHLGGEATEAPWSETLTTNVDGTHQLLCACAEQGVKKVILASSNHAVGLLPHTKEPIPADAPAQPDSYYGFSKAAIEMLARLFQQRFALDVMCLRIGRCIASPPDVRGLINWLSPDDAARLVEACLVPREAGYRIIWGVSNNTRSWFDQTAGNDIGFFPQDDSERFADTLIDQTAAPGSQLVGGHFAYRPLGVRPGGPVQARQINR